MERLKIYFARPLSLYNTPQDTRDVDLLNKIGFEVVNPNKESLSDEYINKGMTTFTDLIKMECDGVAFRSFPDLKISAGVVKEIEAAIEKGLIVFELPTLTESRNLSVVETRQYLTYLGQR